MPFKIIRNDITKVKADAIVNTANPQPIYASGTDDAIYKAAGADQLLAERKKIGEIERGQAAVTPAFALIATGVYGFPKDRALQVAITVISRFLLSNEMDVILVVFDRHAFELSGKLFRDVDTFIDKNYVSKQREKEYRENISSGRSESINRRRNLVQSDEDGQKINESDVILAESVCMDSAPYAQVASAPDISLDNVGETFQQRLLHLIDESGLSDVDVYKRANLDRKLFSKIRCNKDYKPRKKTALALAIALKLNLDDTVDLLQRAELAFSPSSKSDLIVEYFISRQEYDIYNINMALFQHHQPILGE